VLKDGSFLSRIYPPREKGQPRGEGVVVRVLEYWITNDEGKQTLYRLITTILDPDQAPAVELIQLYLERWEFETALDEWKTHLRGARTVLRSQTPELIRQECYGLLLAHFALRGIMHQAALRGGRDPDRLSFTHAVRVVHRSLPRFAETLRVEDRDDAAINRFGPAVPRSRRPREPRCRLRCPGASAAHRPGRLAIRLREIEQRERDVVRVLRHHTRRKTACVLGRRRGRCLRPEIAQRAETSLADICLRQSRKPLVGGCLSRCWCGFAETSTWSA